MTYYAYGYDPVTDGWEYVGGVDFMAGNGCYEWYDGVVFRKGDVLGWVIAGGCSCNSISDDLQSESDLATGTREQLQAALEDAMYDDFNNTSVQAEITDIMLKVVSG